MQDAVITALTSLDRLRKPASFGPWLAGIALTVARRSTRPPGTVPLDAEDGWQLADPGPEPATVVEDRFTARHLAQVVAALPLRVRSGDGADTANVVVLATDDGATLPIWVGRAEALALDGTELPRPSTHRLTLSLVTPAGGRISAVEIAALTDGIFYAKLVLADGTEVDARPSDALVIAGLAGVPIRVEQAVLDAARSAPRELPDGPSDHAAIAATTASLSGR